MVRFNSELNVDSVHTERPITTNREVNTYSETGSVVYYE